MFTTWMGDDIMYDVTDSQVRKRYELNDSMYRQVVDVSTAAIFLMDTDMVITYANKATSKLFNLPLETLIGMYYPSMLHSSQIEDSRGKISDLLKRGSKEIVNHRRLYLCPDGSKFWGHITGSILFDEKDAVVGVITVLVDISDDMQKEDRLRLLAGVFAYSKEGIIVTDTSGLVVDVNDSFTEITGYSKDETIGTFPKMLRSKYQDSKFYENVAKDVRKNGHWTGEMWNLRKNGKMYPALLTISCVKDSDNRTSHYVCLFSDIGKIKDREKNLENLIYFDSKTGLPNRLSLMKKIDALIKSQESPAFAVSFIDIDNLAAFSDQYGSEAADKVLFSVADRIKKTLKNSDVVSRIGGEQFVVLLADIESENNLLSAVKQLRKAILVPIMINDEDPIILNISIGVATYSSDASVTSDTILKQAEQAMYKSMLEGKNQICFFDAAQNKVIIENNEKQAEIKHALETDQFVLFYQPKVNMVTGKIIGAEALLRWQHPQRGLVPPGEFLKYTQELPLSVLVDDWVINAALKQMDSWAREGVEIPISVNVGALKFEQPSFADFVKQMLSRYPTVKPSNFEIEILESTSIKDMDALPEIINSCRKAGIRIAIDDFGAGYSSLTYLRLLPADLLKIDQSFVREVLVRPNDFIILEGIINLANSFGRDFIAEGVETEAHGSLLVQLGCEQAQGYSIARPMPAAELPAWIKNYKPNPVWIGKKRVDRRLFTALLSEIEHRSWVHNIQLCLSNGDCPPSMLDESKCRFSAWLKREYSHSPHLRSELDEILVLHKRVHESAVSLHQKCSNTKGLCIGATESEKDFCDYSATLIDAIDRFIAKAQL